MSKPQSRIKLQPDWDTCQLKLLLDEGVPDSVGRALADFGHEVTYYRDILKPGLADKEVAQAAVEFGSVLVAIDNDVRRNKGAYGSSNYPFNALNVIKLSCKEVQAAGRVKQTMAFILIEWDYSRGKVPRCLYVDIGAQHIRSNR